jgi:adenosine deaminase
MPKAELHVHLDGAVEVGTAADLLSTGTVAGEAAPGAGAVADLLSEAKAAGEAASDAETAAGVLSENIVLYEALRRRMVIGGVLSSQEELLSYYELPVALLQSEYALRRVTEEMILSKAADNVKYCEIRWAPGLHVRGGLSIEQVVKYVLSAGEDAARKTGMIVKFIVVGMRNESPETNIDMLRQAVAADANSALAAVDLAGDERENPDPMRQAAFFAEARRHGLYVTFHCGESLGGAGAHGGESLGGAGAHGGESLGGTGILRRAVDELRPDRVAHGAIAAQDEELCRMLAERGVQLDLCPTSNIQAGLYSEYKDFPLKILWDRGVPVSVSTDSPVISGKTLSEEYFELAASGQVTPYELWRINLNAIEHIFAPESIKQKLRDEFTAWAETAMPQT